MRLALVAFLGAALAAPVARAQSKPSEAPLPSCMDQSIAGELGDQLRPRGVQKRNFLKRGHLQLVARGGMFSGDLMSSSYVAGGALAFWLTEDLGFEASFDLTPVNLDLDKPVAGFFGDDRFRGGWGYLVLGGLLWSPIHAKLKMAGSIVHSDLVLSAGAGRLIHDSVQGISYDAGLALELFTTRWVTFRFDLRDLVAVQEAVAETRITNNFLATAGVSFWIPTGL
ncbi:MAG TPA: outer membrane beta-barrel domain-containing protein [Kofleriaceae bacterium]|nr:outer membrane beta-barrel domain-containing protein [Kofleriaceae bacterium]